MNWALGKFRSRDFRGLLSEFKVTMAKMANAKCVYVHGDSEIRDYLELELDDKREQLSELLLPTKGGENDEIDEHVAKPTSQEKNAQSVSHRLGALETELGITPESSLVDCRLKAIELEALGSVQDGGKLPRILHLEKELGLASRV